VSISCRLVKIFVNPGFFSKLPFEFRIQNAVLILMDQLQTYPANLIQPVYERVKKMIKDGELKPGEKIRQEKMAAQLGISRTPLVKALHLLEKEFFVENLPRRGMYVRKFTLEEMVDAFECRLSLEMTAVRLLARDITPDQLSELKALFQPFLDRRSINQDEYQEADEKFHAQIIDFTGNMFIKRMEAFANIQSVTYHYGLIRPPKETLPEHMAILKAFEEKNPIEAEEAMRLHLRRSIESIQETIRAKHISSKELPE
jgi:DNA-binding GntR family transcriptional regulator